jgi:hypothetical protein
MPPLRGRLLRRRTHVAGNVTNKGTIEALQGGTVDFNGGYPALNQGGGAIQADQGSVINFTKGLSNFGQVIDDGGRINVDLLATQGNSSSATVSTCWG